MQHRARGQIQARNAPPPRHAFLGGGVTLPYRHLTLPYLTLPPPYLTLPYLESPKHTGTGTKHARSSLLRGQNLRLDQAEEVIKEAPLKGALPLLVWQEVTCLPRGKQNQPPCLAWALSLVSKRGAARSTGMRNNLRPRCKCRILKPCLGQARRIDYRCQSGLLRGASPTEDPNDNRRKVEGRRSEGHCGVKQYILRG